MMQSRTVTNPRPTRRGALQRRMMRRIALVLLAAFAIFAVFIGVFIQVRARDDLQQRAEFALANLSERVAAEIGDPAEEMSHLAVGVTMRDYARVVHLVPVDEFTPEDTAVQSAILRELDNLLRTHADEYLRIRYITRSYLKVGEVRSFGAVTRINTQVEQADLLDDPAYAATYVNQSVGVPFISTIHPPNDEFSVHTLDIFVPVGILGANSQVVGTLQMTISAEGLIDIITEAQGSTVVNQSGRRILLVDADENLLAVSDGGNVSSNILNALSTIDSEFRHENVNLFTRVSFTLMDEFRGAGTPWRVVVVDDLIAATLSVNVLTGFIVLSCFAILGVVMLILNEYTRPLFRPLVDAKSIMQRVASGGDPLTETIPPSTTMDEVGEIIGVAGVISGKFNELQGELESQVKRYHRDLDVVARIGREVATLHDISLLLNRAINLICDEFGYYHAQVFLVDDVAMNAVLSYSYGKAGQKLLEQGHRVPINGESLIGSAVMNRELLVINNTVSRHTGNLYRLNPMLAETRAEICLPLFVSDRVTGVLDIHSREPDAFQQDVLATLRLLADQLAIAIYNAQLINQTDQRIDQIDRLNRQLTRTAWEEAHQRMRLQRRYDYNLLELQEGYAGNGMTAEALQSPITVRGEVIGTLSAEPMRGQEFTEGDHVILQSVAERVALAIENARLFQETQMTLAETSTLYQLSRHLNEANTLEDIIHAIIVSVMPDASGGQVWMFDEYHAGEAPEWMALAADLIISDNNEAQRPPNGWRLSLNDYPFLKTLTSDQIALVHNVRQDSRLDEMTAYLFQQLSAGASILIPLSVRGAWRGIISMVYAQPREFSEREGRIFVALIDQAGVAIDNRLLLQQTEYEVARNENLYAASRIINTAQNMQDLVYAAVATTTDHTLNFSLSLLEGRLDRSGWPSQARMVARSESGVVHEVDAVHELVIPKNSPLRQHEPFILNEESRAQAPQLAAWMQEQGYQFGAFFPLFSANQPIALFQIAASEEKELSASDYEVYRALTGQMASQIQIRRLLERTEEALDETRRLYIASSAIAVAQDSHTVYQAAVEHLARPFITSQAITGTTERVLEIAILLASPDPVPEAPNLDVVLSWNSESGTEAAGVFGGGVIREDMPFGRLTVGLDGAIFLPNVNQPDEDTILNHEPRLATYLQQHEITSLVAAPIKTLRSWYGVVMCYSNQDGVFGEQYIRFVAAVADQVALAVDRQRLFEEARDAAERAQAEARRALALAEAGQLANRMRDNFEASLSEVFERVAESAGFDRWMLLTLNESAQKLEKTIANVPGFDRQASFVYDLNDGVLDSGLPIVDVLDLDHGLVVNDLASYPPFAETDDTMHAEVIVFFGKHIAMPVRMGGRSVGTLFIGRSLDGEDVDSRDEQLVATLAAQVAVAFENRQLFQTIQTEQRTLSSILSTLPAGVLVLDAATLLPMTFNEQVEAYLGREVDPTLPFSIEAYNLYRTGTQIYYPEDEMPIFMALREGRQQSSDDIAVILEGDRQIDLLVDAAPIMTERGEVSAIVAAFSDISNLRSLENTLQENLRETVQLYEAQRQLTEAERLDDVLDALIGQLAMLQPTDAYVVMANDDSVLHVARELIQPLGPAEVLREVLDAHNIVRIEDLEASTLSDACRTMFADLGIRTVITIPMRAVTREQTFGWMMLVSAMPDDFPATMEPMLSQLADMASTAVDNRYLIQTQQATLREIQSLYNANASISRSRDIEQLSSALYEAFQTLKPDYFASFLDSSAGLQPTPMELFNYVADGLNPVDFASLLISYELPPDGLYIDDLLMLNHPDETENQLAEAGLRGIAAIHLRPKDLPSGFLVVGYEKPHRFSESENRYLNTLADGASIILNNIILFDQIQQALEETSILYQASRALGDATSPRDVVDVVVNYLVAPHVHQVFVALLNTRTWDATNAAVQVVASWGEEEGIDLEGVTLSVDQFPAWRLLSSSNVVTVDDIYADEGLSPMELIGIESLDARSLVVIPLRVPKRAIGAVWIGSREPHVHTDREIRSYQAFAEQASLSLEASFLFQQTERRARQLETSSEVSRTASTILDLEVLMPQLVDLIKEAFGYDHVQIFLMDDRDDYAELRASTGEPGKQLLAIKHKLRKGSSSVIGQVTAKGEPSIALDTADAAVVHQPNPYLPLTRSEMALPLVIKGRVVGALDVQSNQPNAFNEEDVRALTTLAGQIAVAIDNANLYEAAQAQASNMSFLFEISSAAAAADTLEDALKIVSRRLYDDLRTASVVVYLPRVYSDDQGHSYATLKAVAAAGTEQPLSEIEEVRTDEEDRLMSLVSRNLQPFVIDRTAEESRYLPVVSRANSAVILPLSSSGKLVGLIVLEDEQPSAFDYDTLQTLLTLTRSLSAIIQSTLLLEQLTQTNEQLRELDRIKSDFLANMSHELRTPLNSIIGFSRVMLKGIDGPLTEMQEQDLTTIYNSGQHLLMLINDILDQAKIAAGKLDIKLAYFDIKPLVDAVKSIGVGLVKDKSITLSADIAPNLPKAYGDEFRTRQVLLNLVSNAAKFTNEGSVVISVYLSRDDVTGREMIRIDVTDTGIGIDEKDQPLLFEAFRQVDSSLTRTVGGTGLGLPIAKSLVEMQGGEMFVQSEVNRGSTFSFTVATEPFVEDEEPDETPDIMDILDPSTHLDPAPLMEHDTRPTQENGDGRSARPVTRPTIEVRTIAPAGPTKVIQAKREILLIEDNKDMVDQFRRILQREGFDVQTADHPAYAEAMASNLRPTIIVMDVNFANGEGWNILSRLKDRDDTFDIPVIVVTLSNESERAYQMGAHHFLQRPFLPEQLVEAALDAEKESNTERILIIDDQPDAIRLLTQLLNQNGTYRVFSAESGVEGISLVARRRPDLIILDLRMPDMDGFAVLQELRSNPETANIPVMVVTGDLNLKADEQALLSNVRVLHKSDISQEEYDQFIESIRQHLNIREER